MGSVRLVIVFKNTQIHFFHTRDGYHYGSRHHHHCYDYHRRHHHHCRHRHHHHHGFHSDKQRAEWELEVEKSHGTRWDTFVIVCTFDIDIAIYHHHHHCKCWFDSYFPTLILVTASSSYHHLQKEWQFLEGKKEYEKLWSHLSEATHSVPAIARYIICPPLLHYLPPLLLHCNALPLHYLPPANSSPYFWFWETATLFAVGKFPSLFSHLKFLIHKLEDYVNLEILANQCKFKSNGKDIIKSIQAIKHCQSTISVKASGEEMQ